MVALWSLNSSKFESALALSFPCVYNRLGGSRPYELRKRERSSDCWGSRTKLARTTTLSGLWRPPWRAPSSTFFRCFVCFCWRAHTIVKVSQILLRHKLDPDVHACVYAFLKTVAKR